MSTFDWIKVILSEYWRYFLSGTGKTMLMALTGTIIGFLIGLAIAIVRTIPVRENSHKAKKICLKIANVVFSAYVEIVRGTPMMVQAMIIHYGIFVPMQVPAMLSAIIIISVNTGAYMAEIVRGGILSVDKGQYEGAAAIGMTHFQTMTTVTLPQAIRNIMPSIGNEFVVNIKDSSVLSVIAITELMFMSKQAGGTYSQYVPAYLIAAVIYFVLTFTVTRLLRLCERLLDGKKHYTICGSQSDPRAEIVIDGEGK